MVETKIKLLRDKDNSLSRYGKNTKSDVKLKLGLVELILQALMLILLV